MAVIRKKAVKAFLERKRVDYRPYKKLTRTQLNQRMAALPVRPPIWTALRAHQRVCFLLGARNGHLLVLNDTGTGKSILAIALARYFRKVGRVRQVLVLCPNRINKWEWQEQLQKHSPASSCLVLHGSSAVKWAALRDSKALFVFETYAGLIRMVCDKVKRKRKKGKNRFRLKPNRDKVRELRERFQGLVCDESIHVANRSKLPWRVCNQLAKSANLVLPMTGTPFNRDPTPLWAQAYLVDQGQTLGETLGLFRAAFFSAKANYWGGFDYKFRRKKEALLHRFLANCSISYEADAAELPKVVPIRKPVSLPGEAKQYAERAWQALKAAKGNVQETKNIFLRMRQISSGFIGYKDDETGERAALVFPDNPKLEALLSTIESIRPDHKVIVFTEFTYSGKRIKQELDQLGISCAHLYGGSRDVETIRRRFNTDPQLQVLILQNQFGEGLNLQVAKYGLFYESPVSAITRKQCRRRVERQFSRHRHVFIYDFIMRHTFDERILHFHKSGEDLLQALVRGRFSKGVRQDNLDLAGLEGKFGRG